MNLTKLFVAGLCLTAMTASAAVIKSDSFESGTFTNVGWSGFDSTFGLNIVSGTNGVTDANSPMVGVGDDRVLRLNTEGGVWTNTIGVAYAGAGNPTNLFVDMLVKFVPSEELPDTNSLSGKMAIAVKADTTGTNRLNITWADSSGFKAWNEISPKEISTTTWHRVTVKFYTIDDGFTPQATVFLDGEQVLDQTINGFTLALVGFQGTGFIDEVVVRDDDPLGSITPPAAINLTLSFAEGIYSVYLGEDVKTNNAQVPAGSTLLIAAAQWKEIADVTGPSTVIWVSGTNGSSVASVTVSNATPETVLITAQTETSTESTSGSGTAFDGAPMNKVATWALANSVTTLTSEIYPNYLLNVSTNSLPALLINSVGVTSSNVTVSVVATNVNFTTINGTLKLISYPTLGGSATTNGIGVISTSTNAVVTQDIGTNKFVKALVE